MGVPRGSCVYVVNPKGQHFKTMGRADRYNSMWLLPEEALYLLERGTLDIRWPPSLTGVNAGDDVEEEDLLPMSLQAAHACFIGRDGLTPERFLVYTGLKRLGYTILRAASWHGEVEKESSRIVDHDGKKNMENGGILGLVRWLFQLIYDSSSTASTAVGPVIGLGIHRSYSKFYLTACYEQQMFAILTHLKDDIYRRLNFIRFYEPSTDSTPPQQQDTTTSPFRIAFNVYKPSTPFRKTAPPVPDFRIAVINSRTQTNIPTSSQLGTLLESTPFDPPQGEKMNRQLYMRLRQGYRSVVLAIVDQGVVSYLRIADAAFGKERIYDTRTGPRSKRSRKGDHPRHGQR